MRLKKREKGRGRLVGEEVGEFVCVNVVIIVGHHVLRGIAAIGVIFGVHIGFVVVGLVAFHGLAATICHFGGESLGSMLTYVVNAGSAVGFEKD